MFVTVRFGDKEASIFNPQCKCVTLLTNIKDRCCADDAEIDLSDESGNLKNLRECPNKYADEVLVDRETLVLLKVDREADECRYVPLLNDTLSVTDTFLAQLSNGANGGSRPNSRRSRNANRRGKQKGDTKDITLSKNGKPGLSSTQPKANKAKLK